MIRTSAPGLRSSGVGVDPEGSGFADIACDLLGRGCALRFSAPGLSMYPTIRDGETIHVEPVRPEEVRRADILLYRWERGVRAHRVVRIDGTVLVVRGDAGGEEERITSDAVLGRVMSVERGGRRIDVRGPFAAAARMLRRSASRVKRIIDRASGQAHRQVRAELNSSPDSWFGSLGD